MAGVVPAGVVTEILTCPAACAGEVEMIWVLDLIVNFVAGELPNVTLSPSRIRSL